MIDFTPVLNYAGEIVSAGLVCVAGVGLKVASNYLKENLGVDINTKEIMPKIEKKVVAEKKRLMEQYGDVFDMQVKNKAVSQIGNHLIGEIPESLKKAGYTQDRARKFIDREKIYKTVKSVFDETV